MDKQPNKRTARACRRVLAKAAAVGVVAELNRLADLVDIGDAAGLNFFFNFEAKPGFVFVRTNAGNFAIRVQVTPIDETDTQIILEEIKAGI